jgi:histidinol-phosphatase
MPHHHVGVQLVVNSTHVKGSPICQGGEIGSEWSGAAFLPGHQKTAQQRIVSLSEMKYREELEFALRIAKAAGDNAASVSAQAIPVETKADQSPVTAIDKDNERLICEAIAREFPEDGILGEEGASKSGKSGRRWIIDPIDNTRDFIRGGPFWCVLIALEEANESIVGVAHFPKLNMSYNATRGGGSYMNGNRLRTSAIASIGNSVFCPNGLHHPAVRPHLECLVNLMQCCWSVRIYGGALDACLLAAGQADLWFESKVAPWDLAALRLIVEEANGVYFAVDGSRSIYQGTAIGCAPGIAAEVRQAFGVNESTSTSSPASSS